MALTRLFKRRDSQEPVITETNVGEQPAAAATDEIMDSKEDNVATETRAIELESEQNPEIAALPIQVRQTVNLEDDPTLPTITFRYFVLSILFVAPGAFLSQMSYFRTTKAPYSVFFVQIACHYVGHFLAKWLPAWNIGVPGTKWKFSLNPGPWSIKEHVLVTITAASGATYNL